MADLNLIVETDWRLSDSYSFEYPLIIVHVSDTNGDPVSGLSKSNFKVWRGEDGLYPIEVEEAEWWEGPVGTYFIYPQPELYYLIGQYAYLVRVRRAKLQNKVSPYQVGRHTYETAFAMAVVVRIPYLFGR